MKKHQITTLAALLAATFISVSPRRTHAAFSLPSGSASPGHGISNVLSGSVLNGAIFWQTSTNWINSGAPAKPCSISNLIALPACDSISLARLVTTVWGGTADHVCQMSVTVNGARLPAASPMFFGTTADTNAIFSANSANAYGSGSGLWLITLPVQPDLLFKDGSSNSITITMDSTDGFDGRVHHVTLLAVYENKDLSGTLDYAIAEGSGDIFKAPSGTQCSRRDIRMAPVHPDGATGTRLTVLYTYGDTSQNDRLYFNGAQIGDDNVAQWDTSIANYGPGISSHDVLMQLTTSNIVSFSVGADVPAVQETSLRPQLAVLAVTRPAVAAPPVLAIDGAGRIIWTTNSAGFSLEYATNLIAGGWSTVTNPPAIIRDRFTVTVDPAGVGRFYRLHK